MKSFLVIIVGYLPAKMDKFLEHLKLCHNFYKTSQVTGDPYESAFQEGQRFVVLNILKMLEDKPKDQFKKGMTNE